MLTPPIPPEAADTAGKRSDAVFIADRLEQTPTGWTREVTFWYDGDDYAYGLLAHSVRTEEDARRTLYSPKAIKEAQSIFLRDVRLDMTRPH